MPLTRPFLHSTQNAMGARRGRFGPAPARYGASAHFLWSGAQHQRQEETDSRPLVGPHVIAGVLRARRAVQVVVGGPGGGASVDAGGLESQAVVATGVRGRKKFRESLDGIEELDTLVEESLKHKLNH